MSVPEHIVQKAVNAFHLANPAHSREPQLCAAGVRAALEAVHYELCPYVKTTEYGEYCLLSGTFKLPTIDDYLPPG